MDYTNLREKSIYDFCDDEELIYHFIISREWFFRRVKEYPLLNAHTLMDFAVRTNNEELLNAVLLEYGDELKAEINE